MTAPASTGAPTAPGEAAASDHDALAVVALVGRPNVGKSAIFNRMVGQRRALVEDLPGTTRDRLYSDVTWQDKQFRLVDTGGLDVVGEGTFAELIRRQVNKAVAEASVLLFIVDAKSGVIAGDDEVADALRRSGKPVFVIANKVDNDDRRHAAVQFYELGLGEPMPVSAQHGLGIADVLDKVLEALPEFPEKAPIAVPHIAIVGRPNVGKSMLVNAVLGEERVIVSPVPGTTRDAIDTKFSFRDRELVLVDTAGLRRPGKVREDVEHHSVLRARHALARADTAFVVFDASEGLTAQDLHVLGFALTAKTGAVLVANKWDLKQGVDLAEFERNVRVRLKFASWVSFRIISALEGTGIAPLLEEGLRICDARNTRVDTGQLNRLIQRAVVDQQPPIVKNRRLKVFYATQPRVAPPTFVIFVNDASIVHFSYRRYLENVIRERYGFEGVSLRLAFRSRRES